MTEAFSNRAAFCTPIACQGCQLSRGMSLLSLSLSLFPPPLAEAIQRAHCNSSTVSQHPLHQKPVCSCMIAMSQILHEMQYGTSTHENLPIWFRFEYFILIWQWTNLSGSMQDSMHRFGGCWFQAVWMYHPPFNTRPFNYSRCKWHRHRQNDAFAGAFATAGRASRMTISAKLQMAFLPCRITRIGLASFNGFHYVFTVKGASKSGCTVW